MHDLNLYKFQKDLSSKFPSQLIIDITEICNLACIHCPHPSFKKSIHYGKRYLDPKLNSKMIREVREESEGLCKYIRYAANGEPLVHPKGYEMIKEAVDHSGTFVCLVTNATIMKEKKTRELLDSGIHMIDISIDAYSNEVYKKVRVNGNLNLTRRNVLNLLDWIKKDNLPTQVVVSFVEQKENKHETLKFKDYWESQGASFVVIRKQHSAAGAVENIANSMHEELKNKKRYPCLYPWERLTLDPKGLLAFCPADWTYSSPAGDIRTQTIKEVWQGEYMKSLRKAHLTDNYSCHKFCGQCPDWANTRWPHHTNNRRYASLIDDLKENVKITKSES